MHSLAGSRDKQFRKVTEKLFLGEEVKNENLFLFELGKNDRYFDQNSWIFPRNFYKKK
jgi:hypothetical protein